MISLRDRSRRLKAILLPELGGSSTEKYATGSKPV